MKTGTPLTDIYRPIASELLKVDKAFRSELRGYDHFSNEALTFLLGDPGKRLRPALVLFSAKMGRGITPKVTQIATAVELLHTATLVHDDVLDEADLRRRKESLNARWGNEISVVVGDYLYAKAFILLSRLGLPAAFKSLTETAKTMCVGELAQLLKRHDFMIPEKDYFWMVEQKTASLIESSCELGAMVSGAPARTVRGLSRYGLQFGIGFQIVDDCLDLVGDETSVGKSLGTDIEKGKPTLPLIYLLKSLPSRKRKALYGVMLEGQDGRAVSEVKRLVVHYGAVDRSLRCAKGYFERAKKVLLGLSDGEAKKSLLALTDYTLHRKH